MLTIYYLFISTNPCFSKVLTNNDGRQVDRNLRGAVEASLLDQESQLHSGFWVYKVSCFEPWTLPPEFNVDLFRHGLSRLKAEPSYNQFHRKTFTRTQSEDIPTSQMVILSRSDNELVLLDPMQCYAFSRQGYESHEFTRYYASPDGQLFAQEIVKRIYMPGNRGQELIRREVPGVAAVEEKRVKLGSYDHMTPEGALTSWQFGMGFDAAAVGPKPLSSGLKEWAIWYQTSGEESTNTLSLITKQHQDHSPESLGFIKFQVDPAKSNAFMIPMEMAFNVASPGSGGKHLFIQDWDKSVNGKKTLMFPKRVIMTRMERSATNMLIYDVVEFRPNMAVDKTIFSTGGSSSAPVMDEALGMNIGGMESLSNILSSDNYTYMYCPDYSTYYFYEVFLGDFLTLYPEYTYYFPCDRHANTWYDYGMWIQPYSGDRDTVLKNGQFDHYEYDNSSLLEWKNTPPRAGGRVQAQWHWVDDNIPAGGKDPTEIIDGIDIVVVNATFTEPSSVPHRDKPDHSSYSIPVGCSLNPTLGSDELQELKLTIWDPADVNMKREWTSSQNTIQQIWDGKLSNGTITTYTQASNVFMRATYTLKNMTFNNGTIDNPAVAIVIDGMRDGELEAGDVYHFHYATHGMDTISSQTWTIDRIFRADRDNDILGPNDLLDPQGIAEKRSPAFNAKYVTGSKSTVNGTDLGTRTLTLSVKDSHNIRVSTNIEAEVLVHKKIDAYNNIYRAKITPYYASYESQSGRFGNDGNNGYNRRTIINGSSYYFGATFIEAAAIEGTAKIFKLRTSPSLGYNPSGYNPSASQQWIEYVDSDEGNPPVYTFRFTNTCVRQHQHGARYFTGSIGPPPSGHRSYYNAATYNIEQITDTMNLQQLVNDQIVRGTWNLSRPRTFQNNEVVIDDTGPFNRDSSVANAEKHIDVFYEAATDEGIDQESIDRNIGIRYAKVRHAVRQ